jgi:nucleotide sugar dehydrogenase
MDNLGGGEIIQMKKIFTKFKQKINKRQLKIAVVGLGYVGLPLACEFAKKGFAVFGIDVDRDRIRRIKKRESYITDVSEQTLSRVVQRGCLKASNDFSILKDVDVVLICVPTPLKRKYQPDISYIISAVKEVAKNIKPGTLVILESTTYPGTTQEVILPIFQQQGLNPPKGIYLCFSPERVDPGNKKYPLVKIPKIVGGINPESAKLARLIYKIIIKKVVCVSSVRVAEMVKLLENTFRLINIGLIDELAMMAHKMDVDIWEIINAASTKPFGFMPFYPSAGVGGHCLNENEFLFVKNSEGLTTEKIGRLIKEIKDDSRTRMHRVNGCLYIKPPYLEVLSFDFLKKSACFKPVTILSEREYDGRMVNILTEDGRRLSVTDKHPLVVFNDGKFQIKFAQNVCVGDNIPIATNLLQEQQEEQKENNVILDLLNFLRIKDRDNIRVKPINFNWKIYTDKFKKICMDDYKSCYEYLRINQLPLRYFYALERMIKFEHSEFLLCTGRGNSYSEFPATLKLDRDLCRLIGYYLSEGCITEDSSLRIRFSFNRSEKEYIEDVKNILTKLGLKFSVYHSSQFYTECIKVSSRLLGYIFRDMLKCGSNSYNMAVPLQIFCMGREYKLNVLAGIFRGDASVESFFGRKIYTKNERLYFHNVNTASVQYFTINPVLFQQVVLLLQDLGIVPTFGKKRKYLLQICGYRHMKEVVKLFAGRKKEIISRYISDSKKRCINKTFKRYDNFFTVKVKGKEFTKADKVYSLEVKDTNTFIGSYGIILHNCIPKDPLYLYWKARHFGFAPKFIRLASKITSAMPGYIVSRLEEILAARNKSLSDSRILIIGVTYKKDVKDLRKSPALDVIEILQKKNAKVSYYDPLIPYLKFNEIDLKSTSPSGVNLEKFDCTVIVTPHSKVNYDFLLKKSSLIFDTQNVYSRIKSEKIIKL